MGYLDSSHLEAVFEYSENRAVAAIYLECAKDILCVSSNIKLTRVNPIAYDSFGMLKFCYAYIVFRFRYISPVFAKV